MKGLLDTVYGYISIDSEAAKIIDNPLFQRLGHVRQLTSANVVFPGAKHSRKEHSIGAMHLAQKYVSSIIHNSDPSLCKVLQDHRQDLILAALLHDSAHGPYSHGWDSAVYSQIYQGVHKGHDIHRHKLLPHFVRPEMVQRIKDVWGDKGHLKILSSIVQGPLGVDRMDFIKRDTFFTNTPHFGTMDADRIISHSSIQKVGDDYVLAYDSKIISDSIQGLTTRLYMYEHIYLHRTVVAASILIEAMIVTASKHLDFMEASQDVNKFLYLNDGSVLYSILHSTSEKLELSRRFAKDFYTRTLPKMISEKRLTWSDDYPGSGIKFLDDGSSLKIQWTSRVLSNDYEKEFTDHNIYILDGDNLYSFSDFWQKYDGIKPTVEKYYFQRTYVLEGYHARCLYF